MNTTPKCTVPNCERGMRRKALGLCEPHAEDYRAERGEYCAAEGCERGHIKGGYCGSHYSQKNRGEELTPLGERRIIGKAEHGSPSMYWKGCRCAECREAQRIYCKRFRDKYRSKHGKGYGDGRERNRTTYNKTCAFCATEFTTHQARAEYCSSTCGVQHRSHTPGYFGEGHCPACGGTFTKTGVSHKYCTPDCRPTPKTKHTTPYVPADLRSPLRKGYEDNNKTMFFAALKADCNINKETNCWEWKRRISGSGYPLARFGKRSILLHRASLEMSEGKPLGVLHAHHKCANPACVNPNHLEPATAADNNLEMLARNSYIARIAELERALSAAAPGHEALNRVPTN